MIGWCGDFDIRLICIESAAEIMLSTGAHKQKQPTRTSFQLRKLFLQASFSSQYLFEKPRERVI